MTDITSHELEAILLPEQSESPHPSPSAARATLDACIGRWITEHSRRHGLDHPDFGTPEQLAQDARVDRAIRTIFWRLSPEQATDPDTLRRTREAVGDLITRALGLEEPVTVPPTREEQGLAGDEG